MVAKDSHMNKGDLTKRKENYWPFSILRFIFTFFEIAKLVSNIYKLIRLHFVIFSSKE